ncbi:hypothetical protein [Pontibacter arcticus]|uniref:Uncharacterized protein n=1 Tax=Pontibacter arcticus TaxID=2080288 RepID=A0A364RHE4_9BACT|nr:hypothetical protein [Pontibacter arcticus]RAU83728.1 hypothetical protein DP923_01260 [Pontibacter arcticus]
MKHKLLLLALSTLCLFSCEKKSDPTPEPVNQFNITFKAPYLATAEFEVLISQQDGKVLLDTLLNAAYDHPLKITSKDAKLNITTITKYTDIDPAYYGISTFMQVDPDTWEITESYDNFYGAASYTHTAQARSKITYNIPTLNKNFNYYDHYFSATNYPGSGGTYSSDNYDITYQRMLPSSLTYLLLPQRGKYFFKEVTTDNVRVEESEAKDVTKHNFILPEKFTVNSVYLDGYQKAGIYQDPLKIYHTVMVNIFYPPAEKPSLPHLMYPEKIFEEYELLTTLGDADKNAYSYYSVVKNIPADLSFISKPNYNIVSKAFNNFKIEFSKEKPTYYALHLLTDAKVLHSNWLVQLPAEMTSFNADNFIKSLNPKLLRDKNLNSFNIKTVIIADATGYGYQDFFGYVFDSEELQKKKIRQFLKFQVNL